MKNSRSLLVLRASMLTSFNHVTEKKWKGDKKVIFIFLGEKKSLGM